MALTVKSLMAVTLPLTSPTPDSTYAPASGKGAVIKTISLTNKTGTARGVTAKLKKDGSTSLLVLPDGLEVPPYSQVIVDTEITLAYVDANGNKLELSATAASAIDCVVSGVERDN